VLKGQKVTPSENCPVVDVSWEDATGFCAWLTKREQTLGRITAWQVYRLPTDEEWSWAVGVGEEEEEAFNKGSPIEKDSKVLVYPWGTADFPPRDGKGNPLGNYADEVLERLLPYSAIPGYSDGYAMTSPVGSFPPEAHGLYDMGGNVWEWCQDWYDPAEQKDRVFRGASWDRCEPDDLLSSCRFYGSPDHRYNYGGFRCVLGEVSR